MAESPSQSVVHVCRRGAVALFVMALLVAAPVTMRRSRASADPMPFPGGPILGYGDARVLGTVPTAPLSAPAVTMVSTPSGSGYWVFAADGGVFSYGNAAFYGSAGNINLNAPVIGAARTVDGRGYWELGLDGGVFTYGDAVFHGSTGSMRLNRPVVAMAPTPTGKGYWLVASDGGIFAFGDAGFYGSTGSIQLNQPIVGMAPTPSGKGYWLVAGDGGIFRFGDAGFYGSTGDRELNASIVGMAATPDGKGYWLAGGDGSVFAFGDAVDYGSDDGSDPTPPISAIAATPTGRGYWLLDPAGFPTAFGHPQAPTFSGGSDIVRIAASQVGAIPDTGEFCNPYGPCEAWCALFATWVWQQAGIVIPQYAFTGDIEQWGFDDGHVLSPDSRPSPGDIVLYGTGPESTDTSVHAGIVSQVWPDGAIVTVEGDAGPTAVEGHRNVIINGPFLPSDSQDYNGFPIYAFVAP